MHQGVFRLEDCYEVYYGKRPAGKVRIIRDGLYCRVICRCQLPEDQVFRLYAVWEDHRENLGIPVPEGDGFVLDKRIPAKRISRGDVQFMLASAVEADRRGQFVPIRPEEPFLYIERLNTAFLDSEHGKIGIRIQQNPEAV